MEKAEVIKVRDALKGTGVTKRSLALELDSSFRVDEVNDFISWDDTDGLLFVVRSTADIARQPTFPVEVTVYPYEIIFKITAFDTIDNLKELMTDANTAGASFSDTLKNAAVKFFKRTTQINLDSNLRAEGEIGYIKPGRGTLYDDSNDGIQ